MKKFFFIMACVLLFFATSSNASSVEDALEQNRSKIQDYINVPVPNSKESESKKIQLLHLIQEKINLEVYSDQSVVDYIYAKKYGSEMLSYPYATTKDYVDAISEIEQAKKKLKKVEYADTDSHTIEQMQVLIEEAKYLAENDDSNSQVVTALKNSIAKTEKMLEEKKTEQLSIRMQVKNLTTTMTNVYAEKQTDSRDQKLLYYLKEIRTIDFRQISKKSLKYLMNLYLETARMYHDEPTKENVDRLTAKYQDFFEMMDNKKLPIPGISDKRLLVTFLCGILLGTGIYLSVPKKNKTKKAGDCLENRKKRNL